MLRQTWKRTINNYSHEFRNLTSFKQTIEYVDTSEFFLEVRNLLMMIIIPKKIHKEDADQNAFVRATFARVTIFLLQKGHKL